MNHEVRPVRWQLILKRLMVGEPISSHAELHQRLNKRVGLAVFSSDALSSSAYATDEILLVLVLAGTGALARSIPIAVAVAFVLTVVIASYRQTVQAYPSGGGAYIVAHDNLGEKAGLIAASSLLIDYVLTVSVSVAAGVAAIGAAVPTFRDNRVGISLLIVFFITLANLRGLKESGTLFSIPTYGFLITVGGMIAFGLFKVVTGNYTPIEQHAIEPEHSLTLFLILRAFSSGSTALTGVEAISNGVPAFKPPESRNASQTLLVLGILLSYLFLGITVLANVLHVDPHLIEDGKTVPSQIAAAILGPTNFLFYTVQFFTAMILFLAANTSYADFPRLGSILARDRYLPRVLHNRGDKLAFSNGIVVLAVAAGAVLVNARAEVHRIIPLYVVGVFTSFTLSQLGMVKRWIRLKGPRWKRSVAVSGFGGVTTGVVLYIVAFTKFKDPDLSWTMFYTRPGAWLVIILIPVVAALLLGIHRHYSRVADELRMERAAPRIDVNRIVLLVSPLVGATIKALSFARLCNPREIHPVAFRVPERQMRVLRKRWAELSIKHTIEPTGHRLPDLVEYIRGLEPSEVRPVTVVIPDPQSRGRVVQLYKGRLLLRIKRKLLAEQGVVVISVPFRPDIEPEPQKLRAPTKFSIIVLVSAVHRATLRALDYAQSLNPSDMRALSIAVESGSAMDLIDDWQKEKIQYPLEIVDSPYRSIIQPLIGEIGALQPNPSDAVAVVVPEFVVPKWWQHLLHGQTAFLIKTALLFQPNVFVIDVPHPIGVDRADGRMA
jgi:amino acid transporter